MFCLMLLMFASSLRCVKPHRNRTERKCTATHTVCLRQFSCLFTHTIYCYRKRLRCYYEKKHRNF